jgi:hypothetical protein
MNGKLASHQLVSENRQIDVSQLPVGFYMVKISSNDQTFTGKFVKQ